MLDLQFDSKMRTAWVLLTLYLLSLSLLRLLRPNEPLASKLALVGICALNPGILVYLVRRLRGPNRDSRDRSDGASQLSTWGYFWRALVVYFSQVPILLLVKLVFPLNLRVDQFSALELALWEVPFLVLATLGTWLLFSRDRRGQARALAATVRGY